MSCGVVDADEGNVRSDILMEEVTWKSTDLVRVETVEHGGKTYYAIAFYSEGRDGPRQVHSVWHTPNAARSFSAMNSPPPPAGGGAMH